MDNDGSNLEIKLSGLALNNPDNEDSWFQVVKVVEAAEVTIKQQVCLSVQFVIVLNDCIVCTFCEFECLY